MKHSAANQYYNVYRLITDKEESSCVAVSKAFEMEIEKNLEMYGSIEKVPMDKTVRGIFLECKNNNSDYNFDVEQHENDIIMNQLRPYEGD